MAINRQMVSQIMVRAVEYYAGIKRKRQCYVMEVL